MWKRKPNMTIRKIVMLVDTVIQLSGAVAARLGVEVYHVAKRGRDRLLIAE